MTTYIKPTTDLAFKKLFADQSKKEITISFLNSILGRQGDDKIVDVKINDPANLPENLEDKFSIVDVYCTDQKGHHYIIEMQVSHQKDYKKRSQYYVAKTLGRQLPKRGGYNELLPVIFVAILNSSIFEHPDYLSHFFTHSPKYPQEQFSLSDYYFIELSKFTKELNQLITIIDKWIYLLKSAQDLNGIPEQFRDTSDKENSEAFKEAFFTLNEATLSESERAVYDKIIDNQRVEASVIQTSIEIGREERNREIALNLLSQNVAIEIIALSTGLTPDEINALKNKK